MKVKILLTPLLVVIIIFLMIWMVYPAYTNGIDGVVEKRAAYQAEKKKADKIISQSQNMEKIYADIQANSSKRDVLVKYVPDNMKEEEIIDNLNYLAGNEGLSIINLSVDQPEKLLNQEDPDEAATKMMEETASVSGQTKGTTDHMIYKPKANNFKVNLSVSGSYDKIKNLMEKIYKLERFNKIVSLEIAPPEATGESAPPANTLEAAAIISFNFLKKSTQVVSPEEPVFSQGTFSMKIADDIASQKVTQILKLDAIPSERSNPFAL